MHNCGSFRFMKTLKAYVLYKVYIKYHTIYISLTLLTMIEWESIHDFQMYALKIEIKLWIFRITITNGNFSGPRNKVLNSRKAINKKLDMHHIRKKYYCLDKTNAKRCAVRILKINSPYPN